MLTPPTGTRGRAPFLPAVAQRARGNLADVAAFMLLTAVGTVVYMPLAVPVQAGYCGPEGSNHSRHTSLTSGSILRRFDRAL